MAEFLVYAELNLPHGLDPAVLAEIQKRETEGGKAMAKAGCFIRMWRVPGRRATWSLFEAKDATALHEVLSSFPMYPYFEMTVHPLADHPRDPAIYSNDKQ